MAENNSPGPDDGQQLPEQAPEQDTGGVQPSPGGAGDLPPEEPPIRSGSARSGGRSGKRVAVLTAVVGVVGLIVVVAALVGGMAAGVVPIPGFALSILSGAKPPEHSANYYPEDTVSYAWMTLAPGGGQFEQSRDIWNRLNEIPEFEDLYDNFLEDFEEETNIDFEDLQDWAGPDASLAIVSEDPGSSPMVAITIGVRDDGAAEDFLDDFLDYLETEEGSDYDSDSYEGFDIWVEEYDDDAIGLSGDLMVFAFSEDSAEDFLEEVIDGINGDVDDTLANDEDFQAARAALPEKRFASLYLNLESLWESDALGLGMDEEPPADLLPEWVAVSSSWGDRSISLDVVIPSVAEHLLEFPNLDPPAEALPEETVALASLSFDPNLDNWRDTLAEYDIAEVAGESAVDDLNDGIGLMEFFLGARDLPMADERSGFDFFIDLSVAVVDEVTGVDLEQDFFDHLEGNLSAAAWNVAFDEYGDIAQDEPLSIVALLAYKSDGEEELAITMEDLLDFLEDEGGVSFDSVDVGAADDARTFDAGDGYSPGYVLNDGYLIFGSTEDALEETVELQDGGGDGLDSNPEYQRALELLPGDKHFLVYVNLNEIVRQADPGAFDANLNIFNVDAEDVDTQELWESAVGATAASYTLGNSDADEMDHFSVVLTLFPE